LKNQEEVVSENIKCLTTNKPDEIETHFNTQDQNYSEIQFYTPKPVGHFVNVEEPLKEFSAETGQLLGKAMENVQLGATIPYFEGVNNTQPKNTSSFNYQTQNIYIIYRYQNAMRYHPHCL